MIKIGFLETNDSIWQWIKILWPILVFLGIILLPELWHKIKNKFYLKIRQQQYPNSNKNYQRSTPEARKLGELLRDYGWKVELEKWDGYKHIDIAITEVKVNIEVDGRQHNFDPKQALADLKRTYHSFKKGYVTLRIPNILMRDDTTFSLQETAKFIDKFLKASDQQLNDDYSDDF